jgi:hypothetical protein
MKLDVRAGDEPSLDGPDGPGLRELAAAFDLLPLASLVLAADGSALTVNEEWALFSEVPGWASRGEGWLGAVEPADRESLRRLLAGAVAAGQPGSADFRLTGSGGGRPTRWWWRPDGPGQLVVCVAALDSADPPARPFAPARGESAEVVPSLVYRLFGIGLTLEFAAGLAGGPVRDRLQRAVDEIDAVIRDIRTVTFRVPGRIRDDGPG